MEQNKDQSGEIPLCEQGNFYSLAKVRGFTDFGMTLSGKFYDEALQRFNEQYDASLAGEVVQGSAAVRGEAVAGLPARRFVHVSGFLDADYIDFKAGEIFGGGVLNGVEYESKHYTRTVAEQFVAEGDWREVEVSARAADAPSEPSGLTFDQWLDRKDENGWTEREAPCGEFRDMLRGWNAAMKFGKSRAADALDSQPTGPNNYHDAYRGARDDLADWKRRALSAEESCRKMAAAINAENGPTHMGEPASSQPTDGKGADHAA